MDVSTAYQRPVLNESRFISVKNTLNFPGVEPITVECGLYHCATAVERIRDDTRVE